MDPSSLDDIYGDESSGRDYGGGLYFDESTEFRRTTQQAREDSRSACGPRRRYDAPGACGRCDAGCGGGRAAGGRQYPNGTGRLGFVGGDPGCARCAAHHPAALAVVSERGPYHSVYDVGWDERPAHYAPGAGEEAHLRVDPRDRPYYGGAAPSLTRPLSRDTLAGARASGFAEGFAASSASSASSVSAATARDARDAGPAPVELIIGILLVIAAILAGILMYARRICAAVCLRMGTGLTAATST